MGDEVGPGIRQVVGDVRPGMRVRVVLVDHVDRTIVAQVPVEGGPIATDALRDGWHHDVAAVARVSRHSESPGCIAPGARWCLLRGKTYGKKKHQQQSVDASCSCDRWHEGERKWHGAGGLFLHDFLLEQDHIATTVAALSH